MHRITYNNKPMETPTQLMMQFILENFNQELEKNIELDEKLDHFFESCLDIEKSKFKQFYVAGFTESNLGEKFEKLYYQIFP